jgi:hypothetical protein
MRFRRPPWWTEADEAELEVVAWELTGALIAHRDHCSICRDLGHLCPVIGEAVDAAGHWKRGRSLLSRAEYLRAAQLEHRLALARKEVAA